MFALTQSMRYFLCPGATDMRKSFYTLSGLITNIMEQDVRTGDVYVFVNRNRNQIKILHAEDNGLVLYIKKLDCGTFQVPKYEEKIKSFPMDWPTLIHFLKGIESHQDSRYNRLKALKKTNIYYHK